MGFQKGIHYPHPPRGPARKPYTMSPKALRARRRNLDEARNRGRIKLWRGHGETQTIKLIIWQSWWDDSEPRLSQRAAADKLRVWPSYVCKVQKKAATKGMAALTRVGRRITFDDLAEAQRVSARMRERAPELFAPAPQPRPSNKPRVMTADEAIAETWHEVDEWKRKNPSFGGRPRTVQEWQELERYRGQRERS